jgi:hypothetical protein
MRQNDFGGASNVTKIAARITDGCVTATNRDFLLVSESSQPRTLLTRAVTDSPPCGARAGSQYPKIRTPQVVQVPGAGVNWPIRKPLLLSCAHRDAVRDSPPYT